MTDQTTPITTGQNPNITVQKPKKNFFGGEINFNDSSIELNGDRAPRAEEASPITYKEIVAEPEKAEEAITFEPNIPETPVQTETNETTETEDLADFDPFGDEEEELEIVETVKTPEPTPTIPEEPVPEPLEEPTEEIEEEIAEEITEDIPTISEEIATEETPQPTEATEEEAEEEEDTPEETIELEPTPKTGNELFDKFLSLTDTARSVFALQDDKSNFKIIGGKNADKLLEYFVYLIEDETDHVDLFIKKVETQNDEEEDEHLLQWSYTTTGQHLDIFVDEMLLYQFTAKTTEANGVLDKLNKF